MEVEKKREIIKLINFFTFFIFKRALIVLKSKAKRKYQSLLSTDVKLKQRN
jgi:hypothetical protein